MGVGEGGEGDGGANDVCSLVSVIYKFGNHFEEESSDLLVLDTKEISCYSSVEAVGW